MPNLPGVKVGPLDPDATSSFGQVGRNNSARQLIRLHHQAHPPVLRLALSRKLDPERTKGLDLAEVREYLAGETLGNGDPLVPEGSRVVGASVRGEPGDEQILTFTYETPSKRTGKWFAAYNSDVLPDSYDAGTELSKVREMRDRGVVAFDNEGTETERLRREAAGLRRQNEALREQAEAQAAAGKGELPEIDGDTRPDVQILEDNERLGRENVELRERIAALEAVEATEPPSGIAGNEPPLENYDAFNARDLASLLRDENTSDETRQQVLAYELKNQNRATVVKAAESSLSSGE